MEYDFASNHNQCKCCCAMIRRVPPILCFIIYLVCALCVDMGMVLIFVGLDDIGKSTSSFKKLIDSDTQYVVFCIIPWIGILLTLFHIMNHWLQKMIPLLIFPVLDLGMIATYCYMIFNMWDVSVRSEQVDEPCSALTTTDPDRVRGCRELMAGMVICMAFIFVCAAIEASLIVLSYMRAVLVRRRIFRFERGTALDVFEVDEVEDSSKIFTI